MLIERTFLLVLSGFSWWERLLLQNIGCIVWRKKDLWSILRRRHLSPGPYQEILATWNFVWHLTHLNHFIYKSAVIGDLSYNPKDLSFIKKVRTGKFCKIFFLYSFCGRLCDIVSFLVYFQKPQAHLPNTALFLSKIFIRKSVLIPWFRLLNQPVFR